MIGLIVKSYFLGSVPFAYIFTKLWRRVDIRNIGSENVGTTNVVKEVGIVPGLLTAFCDAGKGAAAVIMGSSLGLWGSFAALIAAMAGHNWPVWLRFHGGGGLATFIGGMLLVSEWWLILALLAIWGAAYLLCKDHDMSALIACNICPVVIGAVHSSWSYFFFGLGSAFVVGLKRIFSIKKNRADISAETSIISV